MKTRFLFLSTLFCLLLLWAVSCKKSSDPVVPKSGEKAISGFAFGGLSPAVTASVSGNAITATVPFGTALTALVPTITTSAKATVSPASGVAQNFSSAVTYTVTAEDGTTQRYTVTVGVGKSAQKDITAFAFNGLTPAVTCIVDGTTKTISATLPAGTDATKLVPTIALSSKATVSPATGVAQDFSKAVTYTVTAEDGSTQAYTTNIVIPKVLTVSIDCGNIPVVWEDLGDGVDYIVKCSVVLDDKGITIKPGVRIQFSNEGRFYVRSDAAFLSMIGTKEKPIILESVDGTIGSWRGIYIGSTNLKNQWEYVTLRQAAGTANTGYTKGALQVSSNARIGLKNCTFSDNLDYGVVDIAALTNQSVFTAFESNTFTNNKKSAMQIMFADMGSLDSKSSFANNGQKYIEVVKQPGYFIDADMVVNKIDVPYRITDQINNYSYNITLNAGVAIEFGSDAGFDVGDKGSLTANGTASDPVKLTGYIAGKGIWAGLSFSSNKPENKLNYCLIDGAGSKEITPTNFSFWFERGAKAAVVVDGATYKGSYKMIVTNCNITNSGGYGIAYSIYSKDAVTVSGNTFSNNTKDNVVVFPY